MDRGAVMAKAKHRNIAELKQAGLKIKEYMHEDETIDWCKIGVAAGELSCIADKYSRQGWSDWAAAMRTAVTKVNKVLNERLAMMNDKATRALINRRNHAKMIISIDYVKRVSESESDKDLVTVTANDFQDVLEMSIIQTCEGCNRQDFSQCKYHDVYVKMCVPVFNDSGEQCPYQYDCLKAADANNMGSNNVLIK